MLAEQKRLEEQITSIQSQLKTFPEGKIICTRNGTRYKWYHSDGHNHTYIPKRHREFAEKLAQKKYLLSLLAELEHEKNAIAKYLQHHNSQPSNAEHLLTKIPEYQELLSPYFKPLSSELDDWMHAPYECNPKYPEQLIHKTTSGNLVRSKSESLIDMILHIHKIPFRYECALSLGEHILYPDFTIQLITTYETKETPLNAERIEHIVKEYFF